MGGLVQIVGVDVRDPRTVPVNRDPFDRAVRALDRRARPELHRVEVLRELIVRDVVIVDETCVDLELVLIVSTEVARDQFLGRHLALLARRNDRECPQGVGHGRGAS